MEPQHTKKEIEVLFNMIYHNLITYTVGVVLLFTIIMTPTTFAEKEVEKPKELEIGMIAPKFTLKDETDTERNLNEFLGKKNVVLAFYPKDFTGG